MKYYAVAEVDVTDRAWVREYAKEVTAMVERRGGRYLARWRRSRVSGLRRRRS
jgi:uncharacterized protein (DUF1330 family)